MISFVARSKPRTRRKCSGELGAAIVVHADDRRDAAREVGEHAPPVRAPARRRALAAAILFQTGPGRKPNASTARFSSGGVGAASEPRVQAGAIEDGALVDVVPELAQVHGDARLAAEVRLLADVRHARDQHRRRPCALGGRVAPDQQQHREPEPDATTETSPMLRLLVYRDSHQAGGFPPAPTSVRTNRPGRGRAQLRATSEDPSP